MLVGAALIASKDLSQVRKGSILGAPKLPRYFVEAPAEDSYCNEAYPLISKNMSLAFCGAPKASTTTWRSFFNKYQRGKEDDESVCIVDNPAIKSNPLRSIEIYEAMDTGRALRDLETKWSTYYTVTVVRNPIKRLLSAYLMFHGNEIPEQPAEKNDPVGLVKAARNFHSFMIRNIITTTTKLTDPEMEDLQTPMTMSPCAGDAMANISPFWQHFYPQHCRCGLERGVEYKLVGKVENMDSVIDELAKANVLERDQLEASFGELGRLNVGAQESSAVLSQLFSIQLFDATVRARADEIAQLHYTSEVQHLRKQILDYHERNPKLGRALSSIFIQESLEQGKGTWHLRGKS